MTDRIWGVFATIIITGVVLMVTNYIGWGIGFVIIAFIWLVIGYKYSKKSRPHTLTNRDALVSAIGDVQLIASELLKRKQESNDARRRNPHTFNMDAISAENDALEKYSKAKESLARERLSTSKIFHAAIDNYLANNDEKLDSKGQVFWQSVDIDVLFRKLAEEVVISLDDISKGKKKNATP